MLKKMSFAFIMSWFFYALAFAAGDPVNMLQNVADNMITGLKANKATLKTKPQIVYQLAYRYVVPHANISAMAKMVLPPQIWNNATSSERAEFQRHFTRTLIRTYASALSSYEDQSVRFFPVRGGYQGRNMVEVHSEISSPSSSSVSVTYRLTNTGGSWKLIDLSVEGVSMLESFRSQFSAILSKGSMKDLLARMSSHNSR